MRISHKLIVAAAATLLLSYFAWEWYLSPRARIERFLERAAAAAEAKDLDALLASFSRDYSDSRGMDYETLAELLERGFTDVDRLNVSLEAVRAEPEGDRALVTFDLLVVAVRGQERFLLVGRPMDPEKLKVELRREDGAWKIRSVNETR